MINSYQKFKWFENIYYFLEQCLVKGCMISCIFVALKEWISFCFVTVRMHQGPKLLIIICISDDFDCMCSYSKTTKLTTGSANTCNFFWIFEKTYNYWIKSFSKSKWTGLVSFVMAKCLGLSDQNIFWEDILFFVFGGQIAFWHNFILQH